MIPPALRFNAVSAVRNINSLTCYCRHHTLLLVGVWSPGPVTGAVEGPFGVDALTIGAQRLIVAFIHICGGRHTATLINIDLVRGKEQNIIWDTIF